MEFFEEINGFWGIHFWGFTEPEYLKIRFKICDASAGTFYSIHFDHYVSYNVFGDGYWAGAKVHWEEPKIQVLENSSYLSFVKKDTSIEQLREEDEKLRHYVFNCVEHTVHIASFDDPIVTKLK
jgi:hypothetical protein